MSAHPDESSPFVRALHRIDRLRDRSARADSRSNDLFEQWEQSWIDVRSRVSERLRRIDARLSNASGPNAEESPELRLAPVQG